MSRIRTYFKLTRTTYIGIGVSIFLDIILTFLFPQVLTHTSEHHLFVAGFFLFIALQLCVPIYFLFLFLRHSFTGDSRMQKLVAISHSFIGTVILFASVFFSFNVIGDFLDARDKNFYYLRELAKVNNVNKDYQILRWMDARPLKGMGPELWTGVDNPDDVLLQQLDIAEHANGRYALYGSEFTMAHHELPLELILKLTALKLDRKELFKFQRHFIIDNFLNCMYFSIITIGTVGYGDIVPTTWYARVAVCIEVLSGLVIFAFAVNLLFLNWDNMPPSKKAGRS